MVEVAFAARNDVPGSLNVNLTVSNGIGDEISELTAGDCGFGSSIFSGTCFDVLADGVFELSGFFGESSSA